MEITFQSRRDAWVGRGRPPREPSANALKSCQYTAQTNSVAVVPIAEGLDKKERAAVLRDLRADMRAAQRVLGGKVHHQVSGNSFKFYWVPEQRKPG